MADNKKRRQQNQKSKGMKGLVVLLCNSIKVSSSSTVRFPSSCKPEVQWMFGHLDANADGYMSPKELYDLEHDKVQWIVAFLLSKMH